MIEATNGLADWVYSLATVLGLAVGFGSMLFIGPGIVAVVSFVVILATYLTEYALDYAERRMGDPVASAYETRLSSINAGVLTATGNAALQKG